MQSIHRKSAYMYKVHKKKGSYSTIVSQFAVISHGFAILGGKNQECLVQLVQLTVACPVVIVEASNNAGATGARRWERETKPWLFYVLFRRI